MCLTAATFSALSEAQQLELIVESAVIVAERRDDILEYVLYNIDGLYVEEIRDLLYSDWCFYNPIEDIDSLLPYTGEIEVVFL